jgi:hypothetical protein
MIHDFYPCPRISVAPDVLPSRFFEEFGANPRPVIIAGSDPFDFWTEYGSGAPHGDDAARFGDIQPLSQYRGYVLANPGYYPLIFDGLRSRFPVPYSVSSIDQRMVLSIGLNGTGEKDLAHHYHPITAMRLLQGRKIWALRPQTDRDCQYAQGTCTDPFKVCDYYARPGAPKPACVQEAGDTIIVPDGWYHGTCNNASVTIGVGFQGRSLQLVPPRCFHCNKRSANMQV